MAVKKRRDKVAPKQYSGASVKIVPNTETPHFYSNAARVGASKMDVAIAFTQLSAFPGLLGLDFDDRGAGRVNAACVVTMPLDSSAGLARAILEQLQAVGYPTNEILQDMTRPPPPSQ